jgi:hypothetical protein
MAWVGGRFRKRAPVGRSIWVATAGDGRRAPITGPAHASKHVGIRFRIGDLFRADDPLARWATVCSMALNDLLLVNRWLIPSLKEDGRDYVNVYLSRLAAAHLYEVAKFLHQSERRVAEVPDFIAGLGENDRAAYERVKSAGPAGTDLFASQLERARHLFFHYAELLPHAEDHEKLKRAMEEHAETVGEIHDPGRFIPEFRARFADDVAVEMSFPDDSVDLREFVPTLSARISDYLDFAAAASARYVELAPPEKWDYTDADEEG